MIINVSGASSTGKTSLVNTLKSYKPLLESIYNGNVVFGEIITISKDLTIPNNF